MPRYGSATLWLSDEEVNEMKKNLYEAPEATVVCLDAVDVITASVFSDPNSIGDGWVEA